VSDTVQRGVVVCHPDQSEAVEPVVRHGLAHGVDADLRRHDEAHGRKVDFKAIGTPPGYRPPFAGLSLKDLADP